MEEHQMAASLQPLPEIDTQEKEPNMSSFEVLNAGAWKSLAESFLHFAEQSDSSEEALDRAIMATAIQFGSSVDRGIELAQAWESIGVPDHQALQQVQNLCNQESAGQESIFKSIAPRLSVPSSKKKNSVTRAFFIVIDAGGVKGVPSAECMNAHLPPRGRRTREDYERAWKECTQ